MSGEESPFSEPAVDHVLDALSRRSRRDVLVGLHRGVIDRVDQLVADRNPEERVQIVHVHLPKLDAAGFIEWDRDAGTIARGPRFDEVVPFIDLVETHADEHRHEWP